jgi:hypothetical protein
MNKVVLYKDCCAPRHFLEIQKWDGAFFIVTVPEGLLQPSVATVTNDYKHSDL